ncbi:hypothetical protein NSP_28250 [Nodularia spumigena CCY9414]|nr:hypothetical protein NSP_28250 [Nodularia spumigena CCY9414]
MKISRGRILANRGFMMGEENLKSFVKNKIPNFFEKSGI